jgi:putative transposase
VREQLHLIRNTFRLTSRKYWDELKRDLKPIYTAVNATAARAAFDELAAKWGARYPAVVRLWDNAWAEFIPFLDYDVEIRRVLCSTNAIESLNARYRRAIKARGHFPSVLWNQICQVSARVLGVAATIGSRVAVGGMPIW